MKFATSSLYIFALWIVPWSASASSAQEPEKQGGTTTPNAVVSLAERTIDAVRNKNTGFLSTLVDPTGISIGLDTPKVSAARFRKELSEKRGVNCVIFDSCASNNGDNLAETRRCAGS